MNHPPTYVRTFSLHKVRENCQFLDHPPTPMSLRNIKMAPKDNIYRMRAIITGVYFYLIFEVHFSVFKECFVKFCPYVTVMVTIQEQFLIKSGL